MKSATNVMVKVTNDGVHGMVMRKVIVIIVESRTYHVHFMFMSIKGYVLIAMLNIIRKVVDVSCGKNGNVNNDWLDCNQERSE